MFDEIDDTLCDADLGWFPEDSVDEREVDDRDYLRQSGFSMNEE